MSVVAACSISRRKYVPLEGTGPGIRVHKLGREAGVTVWYVTIGTMRQTHLQLFLLELFADPPSRFPVASFQPHQVDRARELRMLGSGSRHLHM